jgi:hypothetical protein
MATDRRPFRDAVTDRDGRLEKPPAAQPHADEADRLVRQALAVESATRYRSVMSDLARVSDKEIDRALQRS